MDTYGSTGELCGAARRRRKGRGEHVSGRGGGGTQQRGGDRLVVEGIRGGQVKIEVEVKAVGGASGDGGGEAVGGAYVGGAAAVASYMQLR